MTEMDDKEIMQIIIKSQEKAYQTALETAIWSGTSLIGTCKGKVVKIKPKYKYVLVPIKSAKKKRKKPAYEDSCHKNILVLCLKSF